MLAEFSAQPAAANPVGSRGGAPGRAAGHPAAPPARLPLPFLPGPAGPLRSRGDGIAAAGAAGLPLRRPAAWKCSGPRLRGSGSPRAGRLMSCEKRAVGASTPGAG